MPQPSIDIIGAGFSGALLPLALQSTALAGTRIHSIEEPSGGSPPCRNSAASASILRRLGSRLARPVQSNQPEDDIAPCLLRFRETVASRLRVRKQINPCRSFILCL
jgi:hypothetical protein